MKESELLQELDLEGFKISRIYEKARVDSHREIEQKPDVIKRESLKFAKRIAVIFSYACLCLFFFGSVVFVILDAIAVIITTLIVVSFFLPLLFKILRVPSFAIRTENL